MFKYAADISIPIRKHTSPNLLIKNVAKTIRDSKAFKIYIPNIMTQPGHTDDYNVSDHIDAIIDHAGNKIIDYCICDNGDIVPEF